MTPPGGVFVAGVSGLFGLNFALTAKERAPVAGVFSTHPLLLPGIAAAAADLTNAPDVRDRIRRLAPALVVNAAGLTNVEQCETDPALARALNVDVAVTLARAAGDAGARFVHISTDHLTDGSGQMRRESDPVTSLNVYARTKWEAEQRVLEAYPSALVVRTNFFGWGPPYRPSFSDWILEALRHERPLAMFDDVYFTPILINDLAGAILNASDAGLSGVFNIAGADRLSKYEFGCRVARVFGFDPAEIARVSVAAHPFRARRPSDMSLDSSRVERALGAPMPSVNDGLERLRRLEAEGWPTTRRDR
jgi:dTDP-4-dehydrorhamnose reductase